jgi:hypothetical protein
MYAEIDNCPISRFIGRSQERLRNSFRIPGQTDAIPPTQQERPSRALRAADSVYNLSRRKGKLTRATILTFFLAALMGQLVAQDHEDHQFVPAAAVLPLPEAMRSGATVVSLGKDGAYSIVRKGSNDMICTAAIVPSSTAPAERLINASCYHRLVFEAQRHGAARAAAESRQTGKTVPSQAMAEAMEGEIKAGKIKLPDHPTTGFLLRGPATGYDATNNTVDGTVKVWQIIIIPFATGASLGLPEERTAGMPWVMSSGSWMAHVMVEH